MSKRLGPVIQRLVESVDLLELTERLSIPIKRSGKTVHALCQFHDDTNPSMLYYDGVGKYRQHFHCFVCNTTADLFKITEAKKGLSFEDAVFWLAHEYGIRSHTAEKISARRASSGRESPDLSGFRLAMEIYLEATDSSLLNKWLATRGFTPGSTFLRELAYASKNTLIKSIQSIAENYAEARERLGKLEGAGLIRPDHYASHKPAATPNGYLNLGRQYRDYFFDDRIVFPIKNEKDDVVGFAGRKLSQIEDTPKYLYTRDLPKSAILFGFTVAQQLLKSHRPDGQYATLYVCEGLIDALRLHSLEIPAVALLGAHASEQQCKLLLQIAKGLSQGVSLRVGVFLDRDKAGLKGAAALMKQLLQLDQELLVEMFFVWPVASATVMPNGAGKDPDELLKSINERSQALISIEAWSQPPIVGILADDLGVTPDEILNDAHWELISLSRRYQSVLAALRLVGALTERIGRTPGHPAPEKSRWYVDMTRFILRGDNELVGLKSAKPTVINDNDARLNLARELAESGIRRGELPSDVAAWQRIDMAATAFYEGLKARLKQSSAIPMEPFDAVFVSRGFGKPQPRVKTIACPEDLIAQQYLLNELLTERHDRPLDRSFSDAIPAVRYDRRENKAWTTGSNTSSRVVHSFAYQIDMDVLEGRLPAGESGMFRPFFDCWRDFITSVTRQGSRMTEVYMVRLDVKRYYDELRKSVVRDSLRYSLDEAFDCLRDKASFAPWFEPYGQNERNQAVLDWLLDQSFGIQYYHPDSGAITPVSNEAMGIPQGPVLSAWLATVALFPLDEALSSCLADFNNEGHVRAGFARYVDDIVLLADSEEILGALRATAQNAARALQIELVSKEVADPMSPDQFARHLTEGRALAVSGPVGEVTLLPAGDGDLGWYSLTAEPPKRYAALQLLRDQSLYTAPDERILNQITTALHADDLRPSELGKAARWIWYWAASQQNDGSAATLVGNYWRGWTAVTASVNWTLDPEQCAWDDPAFYALEGLEKLLESAHWGEESLSFEGNQRRVALIALVASIAKSAELISLMHEQTSGLNLHNWGVGVKQLSRMFWQRALGMRWKAARLAPAQNSHELTPILLNGGDSRYLASLRRAQITDAETCGCIPAIASAQRARDEKIPNALRGAFVWLHEAFVRLGAEPPQGATENGKRSVDPLIEASQELDDIIYELEAANEDSTARDFATMLSGLRPSHSKANGAALPALRNDQQQVALATFVAITPRSKVIRLLNAREHLLPKSQTDGIRLLLPSLPGVPTTDLLALTTANSAEHGVCVAEVNEIQWFSIGADVASEMQQTATPPVLLTANAGSGPERIELSWTPSDSENLISAVAPWAMHLGSKTLVAPPAPKTARAQLRWAADVYEAIARINSGMEEYEYVPAWSNLSVSQWYRCSDTEPLNVSLICCRVKAEKVSGMAFVRDGTRGLRSYDIHKENGAFWRAGVALTDALGFVDELDKYSALEIPVNENADTCSPERHLLKNVLRKLRGHYSKGEFMPRRSKKEYMPATLERSLQLLRNYPETDSFEAGISYVLACDMETRAMSKRLGGNSDLSIPGALPDFMQRVAKDVSVRFPLSWEKHLPKIGARDIKHIARSAPSAWRSLLKRLEQVVEPADLAWDTYLYGLQVLVITEWLRALAFELHSDPADAKWALCSAPEVELRWGVEGALYCADAPESTYKQMLERFHSAVEEGRSQVYFDFITPFGWLVLVASRVGLLDDDKRVPFIDWTRPEIEKYRSLANFLAPRISSKHEDDELASSAWPFEHFEAQHREHLIADKFIDVLEDLDEKCGLRVTKVVGAWKFDAKARQFTDDRGETWALPAWRIAITDGFAPEEIFANGRILRAWTESRLRDGTLVAISCKGKRLSSLVKGSDENDIPTAYVGGNFVSSNFAKPQISERKYDEPTSELRGLNANAIIDQDDRHSFNPAIDHSSAEVSDNSAFTATKIHDLLSKLQSNVWTSRQHRSEGHIRVAIMQWSVADSYRHPIYDIPLPPYACKSQFTNFEDPLVDQAVRFAEDARYGNGWTMVAQLPSWEEFRRRRLLTQTLRACQKFGVDLLVLPEYSVRPETIGWLREYLLRRELGLNIIAGTYRLFGNTSEGSFESVHQDILGVEDYSDVIRSQAGAHPSSRHQHERRAMLTLLAPIRYQGTWTISSYSRSKKYASNAADESINPRQNKWQPLFSVQKLIDSLSTHDYLRGRTLKQKEIPAASVLPLINQTRNLQYIAELVCSELFLPMSPINYGGLASEYQKLVTRFGGILTRDNAEKEVLDDINALAQHLGPTARSDNIHRRTVLVVPAMSSRSADYWCFGQAAILAGGVTTIFCNAVSGKIAVGGSCFIGRKSWESSKETPGIQAQTPYSGWSRGIFYSAKNEALGQTEQAVVIADVDPINMNEGRPRQQALPVPLQLVAYLPIAETVQNSNIPVRPGRHDLDEKDLGIERDQFKALGQLVSDLMHPRIAGSLMNPEDLGLFNNAKGFSGLLGNSTNPFVERLKHWKKHWRDQPFFGPPPSLVDWLWVDLTPKDKEALPYVFVPPWTEQDRPMRSGDSAL